MLPRHRSHCGREARPPQATAGTREVGRVWHGDCLWRRGPDGKAVTSSWTPGELAAGR